MAAVGLATVAAPWAPQRWVPATELQGLVLAGVFVLLPFAVGWWLARVTRPRGAILWPLLLPVLITWAATRLDGLSTLDALTLGVMASLGAFVASRTRPRAVLVLAIVSVSGALLLSEGLARILIAPVAGMPPVTGMTVAFDATPVTPACEGLFPDPASMSPTGFAARLARAGARERPLRVLHVGDSMLEGAGLRPDQTLTAELGRLQPDVAHVNAGFGSTGTDFHLEVVRRWTALEDFDLVVLYPYVNDRDEIGRPYSCCGGGALLNWAGDEPIAACETPAPPSRLARLRTDPLPFPLRVAATRSRLGSALLQVAERMRAPARGTDARHDILQRRIGELAASRQLPLLVLPVEMGRGATGDAKVQQARARTWQRRYPPGTHVVDDLAGFSADFHADGPDAVFLPAPDSHWNEEGHRRVARFLAPQIRSLLPAVEPR